MSRVVDSESSDESSARLMSRAVDSESSDESSVRLSESSHSTQRDFLTGPINALAKNKENFFFSVSMSHIGYCYRC